MNDQCKHCTVQGDMPACINTPCSQHASWFAKAKSAELSRAYALIEEMREAMRSTSAPLSEESFKRHMRDAQCHKGITSFDACPNCQRQLRVIKAIAKAEAFLAERVK